MTSVYKKNKNQMFQNYCTIMIQNAILIGIINQKFPVGQARSDKLFKNKIKISSRKK